jgi:PAS domain S-box-containing protein
MKRRSPRARGDQRRQRGVDSSPRRGRHSKDNNHIRLPLAVEVGGIGIFDSDLERGRTLFSAELCAILGLPVGTEMSYDEASRLFDPRDRPMIESNLEAARTAKDKGKWSAVCRVTRSDGEVRWVSIHGRRIYRGTTSGARPVRSIGAVLDITHLKETEAALRESELRLRLALDAARMGTFEADISGSQVRIDEQEARLLGLPKDTRNVLADDLRKRIPFEDLQVSKAKQARMTERREAYHHEFRLSMPDGSERWLSAYADVRSDRIFGVNFDVTERKRAEAALQEREARLRIATDGAALGIFEWDPTTDRTTWENDRIYEIFGRTRTEGPLTKRQFVIDYLHAADAGDFESALDEAMLSGTLHVVCRIKRKDGSRRWLQIDGTVEEAVSDKARRLVGIVADITERKKLEARAQRQSARLLAVQEKERRNIAQELHDSTVQHLVAASLLLTPLKSHSSMQDASLWDDLESTLNDAMKELRTFSYLMHPPALRAHGMRQALQRHVDGLAERSGLAIKLRIDRKSEKLPFALQRAIFRVVQEGLGNAYRHASASAVSATLRHIRGRLHIIISDNGRGLDGMSATGRPPRAGVGLRGIEMRIKQLNGRLKFSRPRSGGTRLHAILPLEGT